MEMRREYIVTDVKHLVEVNGKVNSFTSSRRQWHLGKQDAKKVGWQTNAIRHTGGVSIPPPGIHVHRPGVI